MNWNYHTTAFIVVLRSALVLCALLFVVNVGHAEPEALTIGKNETLTLDELTYPFPEEIKSIVIDGGTLTIDEVMVRLTETKDQVLITNGGTLVVVSSEGSGLYSGRTPDAPPGEGEKEPYPWPATITVLTIDGNGRIEIAKGNSPLLTADTIDIVLKKSSNTGEDEYIGGTIFVDADTIFQSGGVWGGGSVLKTGGGTFRLSKLVNIGGDFTIEEGTVEFLDIVTIGGNFVLKDGNGKAEFSGIASIHKDFVVEGGSVFFHNAAKIGGNLIVGQQEEREGDQIIVSAQDGTVEFADTALISGILNLQGGSVRFGGNASVGTLKIAEGTTVSGVMITTDSDEECVEELHEEHGSHETITKPLLVITGTGSRIEGTLKDIGTLAIDKGGEITGTGNLENIDSLVVRGGTLTFEGGAHSIAQIGIASGASVILRDGVGIQLGSADTEKTYDDLHIEGTLKISTAALGIYKGNLDPLDLAPAYITVAGGTVEIYQGEDETKTILNADTLHTRIVGGGRINVASGVTFEGGDLTWGNLATTKFTGAGVFLSGGGTYQAGKVDLGTGYMVVQNEKDSLGNPTTTGTTMIFSQGIKAGVLFTEKDTHVIAQGDALFQGTISIAGSYEGNGTDLTFLGDKASIENAFGTMTTGIITGNVTGVNKLTVGGDLLLSVQHNAPTISVNTWEFAPGTTAQIRTAAGARSDYYHKVIEIKGEDTDWTRLLGALNAGSTALYRPKWSKNEEINEGDMGVASMSESGGTFLDLNLRILSVNEYINEEWRRDGKNLNNIGKLIEEFSQKSSLFRQHLEGLSDGQLQRTIRHAMAGELAGNAFRIAMYQPAHSVFRHLDTVAPLRSPFQSAQTRGQVREGFHVWFNPYGQAERADREADTFDGYKLARYGFNLGGDVEIYNRAVFGTFFGYAAPNVKSDLGKISANDYRGGVYLRTPTVWEMIVNMMIGFGSQDYSYQNTFSSTDFRGSSLFGSVELSKPIPLFYPLLGPKPIPLFQLTPLVALDFQSIQMDSFIARDPFLGGVLVEPENLSSAMLRVGLLGEILGQFRTRLQYTRQISGEDAGVSQTAALVDLAATTQVRGTQWGKDWVSVGIGGEILQTRHWRIFADYNFDMSKQTTSHLGSLNTVLTW